MNSCRKGKRSSVAVARNWRPLFISAWICLMLLLARQQSVYAAGFSATGDMTTDRKNHTATTLADGRVLITGGTYGSVSTPLNSAEIYDPATGGFSIINQSMKSTRAYHTATLLSDGRVLITGGFDGSNYLETAEIFDPSGNGGGGAFAVTGSMAVSRGWHTATLIGTKVLIAGGQSSSSTVSSAEIFDPAGAGGSGAFSTVRTTMSDARRLHTATLLADGRVLFAGGSNDTRPDSIYIVNTADMYDPVAGTFSPLTPVTMKSKRREHTATLLSDGRVLIAGGYLSSSFLASAEIFDPKGSGSFTATTLPMAVGHGNHTATRLPSGKVLIVGGFTGALIPQVISAGAELFDPTGGGSFSPAGTMTTARAKHGAVTLTDGTILLTGGNDPPAISNSAEIYNPAAIKVLPNVYAFPDTSVLVASPPQSFTITNSGSVDLMLGAIGFSGTDASMFTLSANSCGPLLAANGGNCTVTVNFVPTLIGVKSASLDIASNDPEKPVLSVALNGTGVAVSVTIFFSGTGAGSTHSNQAGLACQSTDVLCQAQVESGTEISVSASGDNDSLFLGWIGDCDGVGVCTIVVNRDSYAMATFDYIQPARIGGNFYDSLKSAYAGVVKGDGNDIQARTFTFTGPLDCNENIAVTLKGGYDLNYSPNPVNYSVVNGKLSISKGSVRVQGIVVRGGG